LFQTEIYRGRNCNLYPGGKLKKLKKVMPINLSNEMAKQTNWFLMQGQTFILQHVLIFVIREEMPEITIAYL